MGIGEQASQVTYVTRCARCGIEYGTPSMLEMSACDECGAPLRVYERVKDGEGPARFRQRRGGAREAL